MTDQLTPDPSPSALLECPHCGELVPTGVFCGNCGAHLTEEGGRARLHSYAAAPHEHVVHAALISTLFPHLPHRNAHTFRIAFAGGLLVVVLLAALSLYTSALVAAVALLPILYLLYLYEVEVYQHEPLLVLATTFIAGGALGTGYALVISHLISPTLNGTQQGPLITGVLLPIVIQLLMIAGPLLLLSHAHFDEALDGLTFGVSSALGFTLALVITSYWHLFTAPLQGSNAVSADELLGLLRTGILLTVVNATTTGMVTAALWLHVHGRSRHRHANPWRGLQATIAVAFAAQVALGLVSYYIGTLLLLVLLWAIAAALLLVWLRVVLHHALLEEGADLSIGDPTPCPECHHLVPTMLFCPACGVARSAAPKHGQTAGVITTAEATA